MYKIDELVDDSDLREKIKELKIKLKEELFNLLLQMGETITRSDKDLKQDFIISGGIKFTRTYNNYKYTYTVEEGTSYDEYVNIDNLFILSLIKEYLINLKDIIKIKKRVRPILETEEITSLLTYKNVEKNHAIFRQRKNKDTKRN